MSSKLDSFCLPTQEQIVTQFWIVFNREKKNHIVKLGEEGYRKAGGDIAFFDYVWNMWGEQGELFVFHKREFMKKLNTLFEYEKNGGDQGLRLYLRNTFRQVCFDNVAKFGKNLVLNQNAPQIAGKTKQEVIKTKQGLVPARAPSKLAKLPRRKGLQIKHNHVFVSTFEKKEMLELCKALRNNEVTSAKVGWSNDLAYNKGGGRSKFFASLMVNDSLLCLDLGSVFCGNHFTPMFLELLLQVFESRAHKPLPLCKLRLTNQLDSGESVGEKNTNLDDCIQRLCTLMEKGVMQLTHLDVSKTSMSTESVILLIKLQRTIPELVYLDISDNNIDMKNLKLVALVDLIADKNPPWEEKSVSLIEQSSSTEKSVKEEQDVLLSELFSTHT